MAFLKFSRDKRGYENFYLLQPTVWGKSRPRLLYWFRTPPNVKVGRTPFDPDVRRALEAQNPDVSFDWTAITQTPIPPPDAERWRERRRVERAMRTAAEAESIGDEAEPGQEETARERSVELASAPLIVETTAEPLAIVAADPEPGETADPESASNLSLSAPSASAPSAPETAGSGPGHRRRRRRRGRRRGQGVQGSGVPGSNVPGSSVPGSSVPGSTGPGTAQIDAPANQSEAPVDDENLEP